MTDESEYFSESSRLLDLATEEYLCIYLRKSQCISALLSGGLRMY